MDKKMDKKMDYIQLPPLPADMDSDAVGVLWEYIKMPSEGQERVKEYFNMTAMKVVGIEGEAQGIRHIPEEEAEGFRNALKEMIGNLIVELSQFSCMIYDLIYVKGMQPDVLIEQHPESADLIRIMDEVFASMKKDKGQDIEQE